MEELNISANHYPYSDSESNMYTLSSQVRDDYVIMVFSQEFFSKGRTLLSYTFSIVIKDFILPGPNYLEGGESVSGKGIWLLEEGRPLSHRPEEESKEVIQHSTYM